MQQFEINGKIKLQPEVQPLVDKPQGGSIVDAAYDSSDAFTDNTDSIKTNTALLDEFGVATSNLLRNLTQMNQLMAKNVELMHRGGTRSVGYKSSNEHAALMDFFRGGNAVVADIAGGNYGGALVNAAKGGKDLVGTASKAMAGVEGLKDLAGIVGTAGAVVGTAALVGLTGANVLANKYQENMPSIFGTGKAFGVTDNNGALEIFDRVTATNRGTGLSNKDYTGIVQSLARYGIRDVDMASGVAQNVSRWAYATGGDVNQYANIAGMMSRYGGSKNVASDFNYLMSAGQASGLKGTELQLWMDGIEKVMEDGIAKGFTRSSKDVADTMLMFSKMSGENSFWMGEQGAKRLNQINAGIAGATALSKPTDLLVYRAFRGAYTDEQLKEQLKNNTFVEGANYSNVMAMMEGGLTASTFTPIMESINNYAGGNKDYAVEMVRSMTGLNYNGAMQLLNMKRGIGESDEDFEARVKKIQEAPENKNNETRLADTMSSINTLISDFGSRIFPTRMDAIESAIKGVKTVEKGVKTFSKNLDSTLRPENTVINFATDSWGVLTETKEQAARNYLSRTTANEEFTEQAINNPSFMKQFWKYIKADASLDTKENTELLKTLNELSTALKTGIDIRLKK